MAHMLAQTQADTGREKKVNMSTSQGMSEGTARLSNPKCDQV